MKAFDEFIRDILRGGLVEAEGAGDDGDGGDVMRSVVDGVRVFVEWLRSLSDDDLMRVVDAISSLIEMGLLDTLLRDTVEFRVFMLVAKLVVLEVCARVGIVRYGFESGELRVDMLVESDA
jgi:hypothetical protein